MTRSNALRREDGGVIALVALAMPLVILFAALVIDVGNWKGHDRKLQTRADAAALAAGVEYANFLRACIDTPGTVGDQIRDKAKEYAGDPATGSTRNAGVNNQATVVVAINADDYNGTDYTDGAGPCVEHDPDAISPDGGLWTDVKITEANIPTFFGAFGIPLDQVKARARVQMQQIIGIREKGLPFIAETGDQVECVWARFVNVESGDPNDGFTVTPGNPVELTNGPYTWTRPGVEITLTNTGIAKIGVEYYLGSKNGSGSGVPCDYNSNLKGPVPRNFNDDLEPVAIDWINVWDDSADPGANKAPKLRRFETTSNSCGGPGFLYTTSTAANFPCVVDFVAEVDTGPNVVEGSITVNVANDPDDRASTAAPGSTTVAFTSGSGTHTVVGSMTIYPNTLSGATGTTQDYTQVGQIMFSVDWEQTTGKVGNKNCSAGNPCEGTFVGTDVDDQWGNGVNDVQHATYMYDPLPAAPLVAAELGGANAMRGESGVQATFNLTLTHTALDQEHIVIFRDSVQSSGNRTRAIWCGNAPGQGAAALEDAIVNGCAKGLMLNQRNDSCTPDGSPTGTSGDPWDCVQLEQGNKTAIAKGMEQRFQCTANNWDAARAAGKYPPEGDQRWAYIILTGYGRTFNANNNDWLPIEGLLRVYVTGWDKQGGGGGPANCSENDDPPRGYDDKGAQIWGHIVEPITIDPGVITGDDTCNLSLQNIQCKPVLVR